MRRSQASVWHLPKKPIWCHNPFVGCKLGFLNTGRLEHQRANHHIQSHTLWQVEWLAVDFAVNNQTEGATVLCHSDLTNCNDLAEQLSSLQVVQYSGALEAGISTADILADTLKLLQAVLSIVPQSNMPELQVITAHHTHMMLLLQSMCYMLHETYWKP